MEVALFITTIILAFATVYLFSKLRNEKRKNEHLTSELVKWEKLYEDAVENKYK